VIHAKISQREAMNLTAKMEASVSDVIDVASSRLLELAADSFFAADFSLVAKSPAVVAFHVVAFNQRRIGINSRKQS
jgi:hypothetical protein